MCYLIDWTTSTIPRIIRETLCHDKHVCIYIVSSPSNSSFDLLRRVSRLTSRIFLCILPSKICTFFWGYIFNHAAQCNFVRFAFGAHVAPHRPRSALMFFPHGSYYYLKFGPDFLFFFPPTYPGLCCCYSYYYVKFLSPHSPRDGDV